MHHHHSLEHVATEFANWRRNKTSQGTTTPTTLRRLAIGLTAHYSTSKVATALGLSGSVFKRWRTEAQSDVSLANQFVTLPAQATPLECVAQVSIALRNGGEITLNSNVPPALVLQIVQTAWQGDSLSSQQGNG